MPIARSVRVTGQVQGVFFRQSAVDQARELGVAGWVRNCPDDSVEAHVEGEEAAVMKMIDWLRTGPPQARVDHVAISDAEPSGSERFEIRRYY